MNHLCTCDASFLRSYVKVRAGEKKIGESIPILTAYPPPTPQEDKKASFKNALISARDRGVRCVILGIPEDIGPRANHGREGAKGGWFAFLSYFLNLQETRFLDLNRVLLLGHIDCSDLNYRSESSSSVLDLRKLCNELDSRVYVVVKAIFETELEPIIIGGGHNNCYPIIGAFSNHAKEAVSIINLDPHADFRYPEGRHSGNGFRYAAIEGKLANYHVVGLDEHKNNQESLDALDEAGYSYTTLQEILHRQQPSFFPDVVNDALDFLLLPNCASASMLQGSSSNGTKKIGANSDSKTVAVGFNGHTCGGGEAQLNRYHTAESRIQQPNQSQPAHLNSAGKNGSCSYCKSSHIINDRDATKSNFLGIELDMDSITGMPASAFNACGISVHTAANFVHICASRQLGLTELTKQPQGQAQQGQREGQGRGSCAGQQSASALVPSTMALLASPCAAAPHAVSPLLAPVRMYLHLCEAAPSRHPSGLEAGNMEVGQALALLVTTYLKARQAKSIQS